MKLLGTSQILEILEDWNFWKRDLNIGIPRPMYLERLFSFLSERQIIVITGPRRSGKSFLMRQMMHELISRGTPKEQVLMVNFEDPRFENLDTKLLDQIFVTYQKFVSNGKTSYIFLDEIQEVKNWEKWVRTMHELEKAKIVISGSNASLLSKELATLLTGRHIDQIVLPLSFEEYLLFQNFDLPLESRTLLRNEEIISIKKHLRDYLEFGGFPEVVLSLQKTELLMRYFEDILSRDIRQRYHIRKFEELKSLLRFYLTNISCPVTFHSLEKFLHLSEDTVARFSLHAESAFLFFFLKRFSPKIKEQEKSPRKVYASDLGLAHAIGFRMSENFGRSMENLVFLELFRKKSFSHSMELYYWKDQHHYEGDFLIKNGQKIEEVFQVTANIQELRTKKREIESLSKALDSSCLDQGKIITYEEEDEETFRGKKIFFIPLWKWLLSHHSYI